MVRVYKKFREEDLDARLILQVHDELIIEAAEKDKDRAEKILKDEMENYTTNFTKVKYYCDSRQKVVNNHKQIVSQTTKVTKIIRAKHIK